MIVAILRFILARMMGEPLFKAFLARMEGKMWEPLKRWFAMGERARAKVDPVKIVEGMSSKAIGQFNKFTRIFAESNLLQTLYHHLPGSIKKSVANVQELQRLLQGAKIQSIIDQSPDSPQ